MASTKIIKSKYFFEEDVVESLAEVPVDQPKGWDASADLKVVGTSVPRLDGYDKVSGSAVYTFDKMLPNLAFAAMVRSEIAHGKIKSIDIATAEKQPGVYIVLTFKNTPEIEWFGNSFLFDRNIRYQGEEIACVVAESELTARKAAKLIKIDYEEFEVITRAEDSGKSGKGKIHTDGNMYRGKPDIQERGDISKGFEEADIIVEDTFSTEVVVHNPTEPHCSVVNWDGNKLTVWDSTQAVFTVRDAVANSLGIPASNVRVIKKYMGGGFGSKLAAGKYTVIAALAAKKIGRPVKISMDRKEMNLAAGNRPDSVQLLKLGIKKDGTLTAMSHKAFGAAGAYPSSSRCSWPFISIYKCENVRSEDTTWFINAGPGRPFRAPGHVQGTFGLESVIDMAAEKAGIDPVEFRLKNYAEKDQIWNIPYTSKLLNECYKVGSEAIGWKQRSSVAGAQKGVVKTGFGVASQIWWGGGGPPAYAHLKLNRDGSIQVISGTQDIGTGTYTIIAQVASEVLEIPVEKIDVILGDTAVAPYAPSSGGSVTAPSVTPAVRDAAEKMKLKLIQAAAAEWETSEEEITYSNAELTLKSNPDQRLTIPEILRKINERVLVTTGARNANPDGYMINTFGAQFAKVEVDTLTGVVKVLKVAAAHDVGRIMNKMTAENQFHGGIIQGLGFALMEQRVIDHYTGKVVTTNMHDYKMPTIKDVPEIEIHIVSTGDTKISSTGVKGIGEPAMIPTAAAIGNAVYNAIGVRIKSLPITPDKILNALKS